MMSKSSTTLPRMLLRGLMYMLQPMVVAWSLYQTPQATLDIDELL